MSPREWLFRLEDIVESSALIAEYVQGMSYANWVKDRKTIDAVVRNLQIIGEAANYVPEDVRSRYNDVPWAQLRGMRNILIHEYFGVDTDILWRAVTEDVPELKKLVQRIIDEAQ